MNSPILETRSLGRDFKLPRAFLTAKQKSRHAVVDVNISINAGDRLGIVGESGSGKTTLAKLLLYLDQPTSGSVNFMGQKLQALDMADFRRQVQLIFQDPRSSLDPRMTVEKIILEPLECLNFNENHQARINEVMQQVELDLMIRSRYPHELSGGQRQRVAIARALAAMPSVLVADEPVSSLDVLVRDEILQLLKRLIDQLGLTLVLISHDLSVVAQLCDKVAVMQNGRIIESGTTQSVFGKPQHQFTKELIVAVSQLPILKVSQDE